MREFKHPNLSNKEWLCPICKTRKKKPVILLPIVGKQEGNICEAEQFHSDCISLTYDNKYDLIYQKL